MSPSTVIRPVRGLVACLTVCCSFSATARGQSPVPDDIERIIAGIKESHYRLLHLPGGVALRYRLEVEQDSRNPVFVWQQGLNGSLNVKWPQLRCRVEGPMSGYVVYKDGKYVTETRPTLREANYNFETMAGVGRDGNLLGQVVNYRHAFSAIMGFPLLMQFYVEMDQYYVPGEELRTEYWLPNALEQQRYELGPVEEVGGVPCRALRRPGLDTVWVATSHGHVVCKREYRYGAGKPLRERVYNLDLREVAPGLWLPTRQVKEEFDSAAEGRLRARYTLTVLGARVGAVTDEGVRVVLDEKVARIEDHIAGKFYGPPGSKGHAFDDAVRRATDMNLAAPGKGAAGRLTLLLLSGNALLGLALIYFLSRKYRTEVAARGSLSQDHWRV
jgi:hypothetical protein